MADGHLPDFEFGEISPSHQEALHYLALFMAGALGPWDGSLAASDICGWESNAASFLQRGAVSLTLCATAPRKVLSGGSLCTFCIDCI